ncbi:regulator of cell morphogenesis and NO signaling [Gracilibacillus ureilyticus]|uniref:Regulator of cell morphogenesis and NO signaling n=1 Tax=Gracilibacillus ureilyticus TaxID=531814 RepID=A0A1H9R351_9BACI|nr:iron-sulfur cluster repair di-iron protein [Gracilibacillus ureilyticus]SER67130.1 regulator of cell morphogenesis and NO signaling [Gracilibacillus ureilyticus]
MKTFDISDTPAAIVKVFPKASDFFKQAKVDFCCGGNQPLLEISEKKKKKIDIDALLTTINDSYVSWLEAGNKQIDWDEVTYSELVDHILVNHHQYLQNELTPLSQFVTKIYKVHGSAHPHLESLFKKFHVFKMEMEGHLIEEERDLFPLIKQYEETLDPQIAEKISLLNETMIEDHEYVGELLKEMNQLTNDYELPEGACNSYRMTYARLQELEDNTYQHIHLENNILFKNF